MDVYDVKRFYATGNKKPKVILKRVSLEDAQRHCQDPESASVTAKSLKAKLHTSRYGDWFDGFVIH